MQKICPAINEWLTVVRETAARYDVAELDIMREQAITVAHQPDIHANMAFKYVTHKMLPIVFESLGYRNISRVFHSKIQKWNAWDNCREIATGLRAQSWRASKYNSPKHFAFDSTANALNYVALSGAILPTNPIASANCTAHAYVEIKSAIWELFDGATRTRMIDSVKDKARELFLSLIHI